MKSSNKIIRLLTFMLFCFVFAVQGNGQELLEELRQSRLAYQNLQNYHGLMATKVYGMEVPSKPINVAQLRIKKKGNHFRYDMGDVKMLLNDEYLINLNTDQKLLVCNRVGVGEKLKNPMMNDLEDMISDFEQIKYKGIVGESRCYVLQSEQHLVELVELYFNANNGLLDKVVYHYNESYDPEIARIEMTCKHLNLSPDFSNELFSEKKFVRVAGNKVSPRNAYQAYTLILGDGLESAN